MIVGSYELIKQIGEGGFARTYLARHRLLDEYACVKQNLKINEENEALLFKEAKLLWKIHHYSLPSLVDFIKCDDGSFLMAMTFIEGKELYKVVTEDYPDGIPPVLCCAIMQRLLNALGYLHNIKIIHGDIKPQNVILEKSSDYHNAVLVDYGLSTIRPGLYTACPGCTPAFAAPEQLKGLPPIPETDMYGLGVTMIHILGGNFTAKTFPETVPKELQEFILPLVRHDPMKRPRKAFDLVGPLSDLRLKLFGARSSGKKFKIS